MDRMNRFRNKFIDLLLKKIRDKELDMTEERVFNIDIIFREDDGILNYYISGEIIDNLPEDILNEVDLIWTSTR